MNPFLYKRIERVGRRVFGIKFAGASEFIAETLSEEDATKVATALAGYYKIPLTEHNSSGRKSFMRH